MAKLIWITGLAGCGKTTIAQRVYQELKKKHINSIIFDGDDFREIMGTVSSHSRDERFEIAMQRARFCKFMIDHEINVVCSTISLFKEVHDFNRSNFKDYLEIFIDCDMEELIKRDKKGLYTQARKGELKNVVGVDISYDKPANCDLILKNNSLNELDNNIKKILKLINL